MCSVLSRRTCRIQRDNILFRIGGSISFTVCLLFFTRHLYSPLQSRRNDHDNDRDDIRITIVQLMSKSNKCRSSDFFTQRCSKKLNSFFASLVNNFVKLDNNIVGHSLSVLWSCESKNISRQSLPNLKYKKKIRTVSVHNVCDPAVLKYQFYVILLALVN